MMVQDFLIDKNLKLFTFSQYENHISNKDKKWDVGSRKFQSLFLLVISTHFSIFIKSVADLELTANEFSNYLIELSNARGEI